MHALISNNHEEYERLVGKQLFQEKYLNEMFLFDLCKDKKLNIMLGYFVNNLGHPARLEAVGEPSFVKKILMIKRELIFQGVVFEKKEIKTRKMKPKIRNNEKSAQD